MAVREFFLLLHDERVKTVIISKFRNALIPAEQPELMMVEVLTHGKRRIKDIGNSIEEACIRVLVLLNREEPLPPKPKALPSPNRRGNKPTASQKASHERVIGIKHGTATTGLSLPDKSTDVL